MEKIREEMQTLVDQVSRWQREYYIDHRPSVDDLTFDRAWDRLVELERNYPQLKLPYSPTHRVGSDLTNELAQVEHSLPVLSLDKAYSPNEVIAWARKTSQSQGSDPLNFTLEEKLDGISIVLYYKNGFLEKAVTRGNGQVGNDVTENVRTIKSLPLTLPRPLDLAVRGEIFLTKSNFKKLNEREDELYANPRNFAAGTIRRKKSQEVASVPLDLFVYEGFFTPPLTSQEEIFYQLEKLGFPLNPHRAYFGPQPPKHREFWEKVGTLEDIEGYVAEAQRKRESLDWEIDGLVIKVDDTDTRDRLGHTGHHPRWALAYKFESPQGISTLLGIDLQVGRTGRITPVARIAPVLVGGSTISNVTLHNQSYIQTLDLGVGDEVVISKRGDVIPAVERVLEKKSSRSFSLPSHCPSCQEALVEKGAHLFCTNPHCPAQVKGRLQFFVAKAQMDIDGLGPETIDHLIQNHGVERPGDLYRLDYSRLQEDPGFGEKKVALIQKGLEKSKTQPFSRVLVSLGIPEFGKKAVQTLLENGFDTMEKIILLSQNPQEITLIPGFGEITARTLARELALPEIQNIIRDLGEIGFSMQEVYQAPKSQALEGTSWCVTGSFVSFKPRDLAEKEITHRGGRVVSAVSSNTTHLLAGEKAGSKLEKAQKLGLNILKEEEFLELLRDHPLDD